MPRKAKSTLVKNKKEKNFVDFENEDETIEDEIEDILDTIDEEIEEIESELEENVDFEVSDIPSDNFEKVSSELNEILKAVEEKFLEEQYFMEEDDELLTDEDFPDIPDSLIHEFYEEIPRDTIINWKSVLDILWEEKDDSSMERDLSNIFDMDVKEFIRISDKYAPLDHEDEKKYLLDAQKWDEYVANYAREKLILHNLRLVISIANYFKFKISLPFMELLQEGVVWLLKAIKEFDRSKFGERKFSTYAWRKIENSLYWLRWKTSWIKITEWNFYAKQKLEQFIFAYKEEHWEEPSKKECCEKLGLKPKKFEYLKNYVSQSTSLSTRIWWDSEDGKTLEDFISDIDDDEYESVWDTIDSSLELNIMDFIKENELTPKERKILEFLYETPFHKKNNNPADFREVIDYEYLWDLFWYTATRMKQLQKYIIQKMKYFVKKHQDGEYKIPTKYLLK